MPQSVEKAKQSILKAKLKSNMPKDAHGDIIDRNVREISMPNKEITYKPKPTSRDILQRQAGPAPYPTGPVTTSPTPNGSLYNMGPWSDNLRTTTLTRGMLNRERSRDVMKKQPEVNKSLPEQRVNEGAVRSKKNPNITKDMPEMRPGDNPKRQVLMNILQQK